MAASGNPVVDYAALFQTPATEQLKASRDYARSANAPEAAAGCVEAIRRYGFCVLDDVIPLEAVDAVCEEIRAAPAKNRANKEAVAAGGGLQRTGRLPYASEPVSDLVWMPLYTSHLAHPTVTAVARAMLDDHLRIAQFNFRAIGVSDEEKLRDPGQWLKREWHTDWPHDLSAYGAGEKGFRDGEAPRHGSRNAGCVRQPFPDVCMALTMIWYLTDGNERTGATWIVPGRCMRHRPCWPPFLHRPICHHFSPGGARKPEIHRVDPESGSTLRLL
jgi:ectoine hydroxylase-related dioxygenase (phytanoyl-CoA dioxygenase family)